MLSVLQQLFVPNTSNVRRRGSAGIFLIANSVQVSAETASADQLVRAGLRDGHLDRRILGPRWSSAL